MYKEALLKKSEETPEEQELQQTQVPTPQVSPSCSVTQAPPSPNPNAKLPSVEFFANFRDSCVSHETYSVTSTENTQRSKGMTPSDSWADDDEEFMESVVQALRDTTLGLPSGSLGTGGAAKKHGGSRKNRGWKVASKQSRQDDRSSRSRGGGAGGTTAGGAQRNDGNSGANAPAQLSGGRFDALSRK